MIFPIDPKISNYELNKLFFIKNRNLNINNNNNFTYDDSEFGMMYNNRCFNYKNKNNAVINLILNSRLNKLLYTQGHNRLRLELDLPPNVIARKILRVAQYYNIKGIKSKTWYEIIKMIQYSSKWYYLYTRTNKSVSLKEFMEINALKEIDELISTLNTIVNRIDFAYEFNELKNPSISKRKLMLLLVVLKPKILNNEELRDIKMFSYFLSRKNKRIVNQKVDEIMKSLKKMKAKATRKLNEAVDEFLKIPFDFFIQDFRKRGLKYGNYIELLLNVDKKRIKKYLENLSNEIQAIESNKRFNEARKLNLRKLLTENLLPYSKTHMPNKQLEKTKIAKTRLANGPLTMMNEWHKARFNSGPHENLGPISLKKLYGKKTKRSSSPPASLGGR